MLGAVVGAALAGIGRRPRTLDRPRGHRRLLDLRRRLAEHPARRGDGVRRPAGARVGTKRVGRGRPRADRGWDCSLIDPATVNDVGFQLSVAATAGLLVWSARAGAWFDAHLPRRTPAWLRESLAVSTAAQAATLPLILFHFASLSLVSPLANLLIAPLVAPAMLLTALAMAAGASSASGCRRCCSRRCHCWVAWSSGPPSRSRSCARPCPSPRSRSPQPLNLVAAAGLRGRPCMVCARDDGPLPSRTAHEKAEGPRLLAPPCVRARQRSGSLSSSIAANGTRPDGRLHVTVLDVGQGDAIYSRVRAAVGC